MIYDKNTLNASIRDLKSKQAFELEGLKAQFHTTYESLKPLNFIKSTVHDMTTSPEIKTDLMNSVLGIGTGYLSKMIVVGSSQNPFLKVAGGLLQQAIGNAISNNSDKIIKSGENILQKVLKFRFNDKEGRFYNRISKYRDVESEN